MGVYLVYFYQPENFVQFTKKESLDVVKFELRYANGVQTLLTTKLFWESYF